MTATGSSSLYPAANGASPSLAPMEDAALKVELDWAKFVSVQLLPSSYDLPLHSVTRDHLKAVTIAWRMAVAASFQRVGITLFEHQRVGCEDDLLRISAVHGCQKHLFPHLPALTPYVFNDFSNEVKLIEWVKMEKPDVIIGFNNTHYAMLLAAFGREMPYISLQTSKASGVSGVDEINGPICSKEAVNLLHFCRRAHQWGIPHQRIDHMIEPTWYEGKTWPKRSELGLRFLR